jgi:hypothetical protein
LGSSPTEDTNPSPDGSSSHINPVDKNREEETVHSREEEKRCIDAA